MSKLVQLVYISKANFNSSAKSGNIGPEVSRILRTSRINNRKRNIVGALYFGNGYFFQCLQGDENALLALYEILKMDTRHTDLHTLSLKEISQRSFSDWEMKYLPAEDDVKKLLGTFGMTEFNPYAFDEKMTEKMLQLLISGPDFVLPEQDGAAGEEEGSACLTWKLSTLVLAGLLCADLAWRFLG